MRSIQKMCDLIVMYTQVDVAIKDSELSPQTLAKQADQYSRLFKACLSDHACVAITTWGIGDQDSWIPKDAGESYAGWGTPLLFDKTYLPKPAFHSVKKQLLKSIRGE